MPSCPDGCPGGTFAFDAFSRPHGANSRGWFIFDFPGYASFTGRVTCLDVSGRNATIFGEISTGTGAADLSTFTGAPVYFVAVVKDRGAGYPGRPAPDKISLVAWDDTDGWAADPGIAVGDICGNPFTAIGSTTMYGLVSGQIKVIDR